MSGRPPLTPDLRKRLGLPRVPVAPYPWPMAILIVLLGVVPLWFATYRAFAAVFLLVGLVILPGMRWLERREWQDREHLYAQGQEGFGVVLAVEPAGTRQDDHLVRLEIFTKGKKIQAFTKGSPLARKGLGPGDEVKVIFDEHDPRRCLLLERAHREVVDAVFED